MTPAEALEQVRALAEARNEQIRDNYRPGSRVAEEVIASGQALIPTSDLLAILDAVTPEAAPSESEYREAYEGWRAEGQRLHAALLTIWRGLGEDREYATFGDDPQAVVAEWVASRSAPVTVEGLPEAVARHMFENRTLGLDQDPDEEGEWEFLPWRDEWIEGAETAIEGVRRAGYVLAPTTPERAEQEREAAVERVARAAGLITARHAFRPDTCVGCEYAYETALRIITAYEGREVS